MPTKVEKNGKAMWFARVQKQGLIRSKYLRTRAEALAWEAEQRELDWTKTHTDCLTIHDLATQYLDDVKGRFAPKTYWEKKKVFKELFKMLDPKTLATSLQPKQILDFLTEQFDKRSGVCANRDRKNLVAAWNWGMKYLGLPGPNPASIVDKFPEERKPRYVPPEEDFWKVYDIAEDQDKVMLAVVLYTAARRGEVYRLGWEDVDFQKNRIRLSTKKRQNSSLEFDWLPMASELRRLLRDWWERRTFKDSPWVFVNENEMAAHSIRLGQPFTTRRTFMPNLCKKAGIKPFGFHAIRHLTASILYRQGYALSVIQAVLRHQSATTTTKYLKSLGLEEVRPALDDLSRKPAQVLEFKAKKSKRASGDE